MAKKHVLLSKCGVLAVLLGAVAAIALVATARAELPKSPRPIREDEDILDYRAELLEQAMHVRGFAFYFFVEPLPHEVKDDPTLKEPVRSLVKQWWNNNEKRLRAEARKLDEAAKKRAAGPVPKDAPPWVREAAALRMELKASHGTVAAGEDVGLDLSITNVSQAPIRIWLRPDEDPQKTGLFAAVVAVVQTPDGSRVELRRPTLHIVKPLVIDLPHSPRRELKPGEAYHERVVLNRWSSRTSHASLAKSPNTRGARSPIAVTTR